MDDIRAQDRWVCLRKYEFLGFRHENVQLPRMAEYSVPREGVAVLAMYNTPPTGYFRVKAGPPDGIDFKW